MSILLLDFTLLLRFRVKQPSFRELQSQEVSSIGAAEFHFTFQGRRKSPFMVRQLSCGQRLAADKNANCGQL